MARLTIIKRVVDALHLQNRVILHLECMHNVSIPALRFVAAETPLVFEVGDEHLCPYCPDALPPPADPPKPAPEVREEFDALFGGKL